MRDFSKLTNVKKLKMSLKCTPRKTKVLSSENDLRLFNRFIDKVCPLRDDTMKIG